DLSNLKLGQVFELPEDDAPYILSNQGPENPSFILYAVEKGSMNYNTKVLYLTTQDTITYKPTDDKLLTVLSQSGVVRFSDFGGDFSGAPPAVYAAGFDALIGCRPVFNGMSASYMANTNFPVYSPMTTIDFKKTGSDRSVQLSSAIVATLILV
ncbi:hypothetical protein PMAYCL1PPCAC_00850, partial [Pristionchus mayeri]